MPIAAPLHHLVLVRELQQSRPGKGTDQPRPGKGTAPPRPGKGTATASSW